MGTDQAALLAGLMTVAFKGKDGRLYVFAAIERRLVELPRLWFRLGADYNKEGDNKTDSPVPKGVKGSKAIFKGRSAVELCWGRRVPVSSVTDGRCEVSNVKATFVLQEGEDGTHSVASIVGPQETANIFLGLLDEVRGIDICDIECSPIDLFKVKG